MLPQAQRLSCGVLMECSQVQASEGSTMQNGNAPDGSVSAAEGEQQGGGEGGDGSNTLIKNPEMEIAGAWGHGLATMKRTEVAHDVPPCTDAACACSVTLAADVGTKRESKAVGTHPFSETNPVVANSPSGQQFCCCGRTRRVPCTVCKGRRCRGAQRLRAWQRGEWLGRVE